MPDVQWHAKVASHRDANGLMEVTQLDEVQVERIKLSAL
jgi:hypothetical protein